MDTGERTEISGVVTAEGDKQMWSGVGLVCKQVRYLHGTSTHTGISVCLPFSQIHSPNCTPLSFLHHPHPPISQQVTWLSNTKPNIPQHISLAPPAHTIVNRRT